MDVETIASVLAWGPSVDALGIAGSNSESLLLTRFEKLLVLQKLVQRHLGENLEVHEREEVGL